MLIPGREVLRIPLMRRTAHRCRPPVRRRAGNPKAVFPSTPARADSDVMSNPHDFFFEGAAVGYFRGGAFPQAARVYRYEPYRSLSHLSCTRASRLTRVLAVTMRLMVFARRLLCGRVLGMDHLSVVTLSVHRQERPDHAPQPSRDRRQIDDEWKRSLQRVDQSLIGRDQFAAFLFRKRYIQAVVDANAGRRCDLKGSRQQW